jgi:hypothetical protein
LEGILSLRQVCFFEISINSLFFNMTFFKKKKKIHLLEGLILKFINTKTEKR